MRIRWQFTRKDARTKFGYQNSVSKLSNWSKTRREQGGADELPRMMRRLASLIREGTPDAIKTALSSAGALSGHRVCLARDFED